MQHTTYRLFSKQAFKQLSALVLLVPLLVAGCQNESKNLTMMNVTRLAKVQLSLPSGQVLLIQQYDAQGNRVQYSLGNGAVIRTFVDPGIQDGSSIAIPPGTFLYAADAGGVNADAYAAVTGGGGLVLGDGDPPPPPVPTSCNSQMMNAKVVSTIPCNVLVNGSIVTVNQNDTVQVCVDPSWKTNPAKTKLELKPYGVVYVRVDAASTYVAGILQTPVIIIIID